MHAPTSSPRPLALSDSEISHIMAAARPLSPADRDAFLQHIAAALAALPMWGEGAVARTVREVFKQHGKAPELDVKPSKYGRSNGKRPLSRERGRRRLPALPRLAELDRAVPGQDVLNASNLGGTILLMAADSTATGGEGSG